MSERYPKAELAAETLGEMLGQAHGCWTRGQLMCIGEGVTQLREALREKDAILGATRATVDRMDKAATSLDSVIAQHVADGREKDAEIERLREDCRKIGRTSAERVAELGSEIERLTKDVCDLDGWKSEALAALALFGPDVCLDQLCDKIRADKAEIERLQRYHEGESHTYWCGVRNENTELRAEIERLREEIELIETPYQNLTRKQLRRLDELAERRRGLQEPPDNCPPPECLCSEQWASELCPRHKHLDPDSCPPEEE